MSEQLRDGTSRQLKWGAGRSGRLRGKDYYEKLKLSDQVQFDALFNRMADEGWIHGDDRFRNEGDGLYVLKIWKHRLACFFDDQEALVIIHGFPKKTDRDRRSRRELATARRLRDEHLERENR